MDLNKFNRLRKLQQIKDGWKKSGYHFCHKCTDDMYPHIEPRELTLKQQGHLHELGYTE